MAESGPRRCPPERTRPLIPSRRISRIPPGKSPAAAPGWALRSRALARGWTAFWIVWGASAGWRCWAAPETRNFPSTITEKFTPRASPWWGRTPWPGPGRNPIPAGGPRGTISHRARPTQAGRIRLSSLVDEVYSPAQAPAVYARLAVEKAFPLVQFDWRNFE